MNNTVSVFQNARFCICQPIVLFLLMINASFYFTYFHCFDSSTATTSTGVLVLLILAYDLRMILACEDQKRRARVISFLTTNSLISGRRAFSNFSRYKPLFVNIKS